MSSSSGYAEILQYAIHDLRRQGRGRRDAALLVMDAGLLEELRRDLLASGDVALHKEVCRRPPQFMGVEIHVDPNAAQIRLIATDGQIFTIGPRPVQAAPDASPRGDGETP